MANSETTLSRRRFVRAVCPLVLGGLTLPQDQPGFWSEFTSEERESVGRSVMAQRVPSYLGEGFGCAEICLAASIDYLGVSRDWLDAAAVFSGGFGQGDLCGFLTGGMMAIGVAAGKLHDDRQALQEFARPRSQAYWQWWTSRGPVHCSELRTRYEGREQFVRMAQRVMVTLEGLIEPAQ